MGHGDLAELKARSTTSDMADHALEYQPNRTTRDSRTQDTAHLSHLHEAMSIYHTPPNNMGISLSSVIVIIQGEFLVSVSPNGIHR